MRAHAILPFLLIAGVLSSGKAEREDILRKNELIPHHLHLIGYMNTTLKDVEEFDEKMCAKVGGPGTYDLHKKNWGYFTDCLTYIKNQVGEELNSMTFDSMHHRIKTSYEKHCQKVSNIEHCFKNVTESMKICLEPDKHETTNIMYRTISAVIQHMCKDGAIRMIEFETAGSDECIDANVSDLLNCANRTVLQYIRKTVPHGAAVGGLGALHLLVPDTLKCTLLDEFHRCATDILQKKCKTTNTAGLFDGAFNSVIKATTCDRILPKSLTKSSSVITASVSGLLTIAVTTILVLLFA